MSGARDKDRVAGAGDVRDRRIRQLPREVYDLIAAGEVVTAPLSVVKELVENSIDAGATRIVVEIEEGGISLIRVSDNGCGIASADLPLAFAPHATSKISVAEDLSQIFTLGFRGEALASIATVARVTLVTKAANAPAGSPGVRVTVAGGIEESSEPAGAETGTSVTVADLFFNLPARRKHLNAARSEAAKVVDFCSRMAVCYTEIAFRLVSNGTVLFATRGNGDRLAAITTVYGTGVAAALVAVDAEDAKAGGRMPPLRLGALDASAGMRLSGYVSDPTGLRKSRRGQVLFVNGRSVRNAAVDAAIDRAYREFAEPGRFPVSFLFLSVDPTAVDVNVHPAKSEVTFFDAAAVGDFIEAAVRGALASERGIPRLRLPGRKGAADRTFRMGDGTAPAPESALPRGGSEDEGADARAVADGDNGIGRVATDGGHGAQVASLDVGALLSFRETPVEFGGARDSARGSDAAAFPASAASVEAPAVGFLEPPETVTNAAAEPAPAALAIDRLRVLASLFATYLLAADGDSFYIIDQHAAHERVNYEKFLRGVREKEPQRQALLTPYLFTAPASAHADFERLLPQLARLGYEIDEFGDDGTYAARTFPAFLSHAEGAAFLTELLGEADAYSLKKNPTPADNAALTERLILRACKTSVKANDALTEPETAQLLNDLQNCENPYTCPHGRPVFLKLTKSDIERLFKRA
ncbi:MAG: DNA mismatch repair endonuclease MutL [Clostridiales Family XIII bacterium]|nr:DNA mismatch repair endonuclease MutL [Clostridiales Family XIII bacterium]